MTPPDPPAFDHADTAELEALAGRALVALAVRRTVRGLLVAALVGPVLAFLVHARWVWPYRAAVVVMWAAHVQVPPLRRWWRIP
jgi:hypothetical protein